MPSKKVLEQKQKIVAEVAEKLKAAAGGTIVNYQGITVENDTALRVEMRKAGIEYFVIKNTLLKRAVEIAGLPELSGVLENMTAIAISENDPVAPARILCSYADKIETFNIKAGFVDGKVIGVSDVVALSKLPSRDTLVAQVVGTLAAPISGLVNVLNANISGLARVLQAVADKKGA